ncbi:MAG: acyl carrier protein [Pseudomonadota bacterium]
MRIIEMLVAATKSEGPFTAETRILADTSFDSVNVLDFVLELEDEFDVTVPLNRMAEIETVGDLATAIQTLIEQ